MKQVKLRGVLGVALLATFIAAWLAPSSEGDGVTLSKHAQNATTRTPAATRTTTASRDSHAKPVEVLRIRPRDEDDADDARIFASTQWVPSVKSMPVSGAAPVETAPAAPQAPPLPFRVLGRYEESGQTVVFLQHNDQNLVVRVGDTIAEQYKVESLNGSTLNLRSLPLNQPQTLEVGATQ